MLCSEFLYWAKNESKRKRKRKEEEKKGVVRRKERAVL